MMPHTLKLAKHSKLWKISRFPNNFQKKLRKILKFDILSAKSISVTEIKWKWYPIHRNWSKKANSGEFPDFQKISGKNPEKLEIWNSEFKIKFCNLHWVGKIPNILKLAKKQPIPGHFEISRLSISRFQKISGNSKSAKNYCEYITIISSINI